MSVELFITGLVFWFGCGVVTSRIAAELRGRSANPWFWIGFLLGPIGIIAAVALQVKRPCPQCQGMIDPQARKCQHCGSDVDPTPLKQHDSA